MIIEPSSKKNSWHFLLLDKKNRKLLRDPYLYLAFIAAFAVFSGVVYWNATHEWASFKFQFANRTSGLKPIRAAYIIQLIGSQLFILTPLLFILFLTAANNILKRWRERRAEQFYFLSSAVILVMFCYLGTNYADQNQIPKPIEDKHTAGTHLIFSPRHTIDLCRF